MTDIDPDKLLNDAIRGLQNQQVPDCPASLLPDATRSQQLPERANPLFGSLAVMLALSMLFAVLGYVVFAKSAPSQTQRWHGEHASSAPRHGPRNRTEILLAPGENIPGLIHRSPITVATGGSTGTKELLQQQLLTMRQRLRELTERAALHQAKERVQSLRLQLETLVALSE